jgi:integrase
MKMRQEAGESWNDLGPGVLHPAGVGTRRQTSGVRSAWSRTRQAQPQGVDPRELRHSFVSLLSSSGVTIEEIAPLVGHRSTSVTERVCRKELRPVITRGARAINQLFDGAAKR